ncbi:MAG: hypothetical protein AB7I36_08185 [Rhodospirillaceae bacterium]
MNDFPLFAGNRRLDAVVTVSTTCAVAITFGILFALFGLLAGEPALYFRNGAGVGGGLAIAAWVIIYRAHKIDI